MMLKGIYNKMAHMNYYTYTEHQTDDEVEGEIILKNHTLPELPYELICDILYKFGGMESPIVKGMKELKSKVFEKVDLPLRNLKWINGGMRCGNVLERRLTSKSSDFVVNICKNLNGELDNGYYYRGRYFNSNMIEVLESVKIKEGEHTYIDNDIFDGWSMEVRIDNKDKYIPYSKGTLKEVQEYYGRHLINIKMTAKQLKEHLDNNGIEYKKSWNKKKLLKVCYSF